MAHQERHLKSSDLITDIAMGMSDGPAVPCALAAGLNAAVSKKVIVIAAGIAEIVAGCIAMGLAGYLTGKTICPLLHIRQHNYPVLHRPVKPQKK